MKNRCLSILCIILSLYSCTNKVVDSNSWINIPIDMSASPLKDVSDVLEKIEIVPLETNDVSLIGFYSKFIYDEKLDKYIVLDNDHIISVFDSSGKFLSNSKLRIGEGPEDYYIPLDVCYNHFHDCLEVLLPYGYIMRYDLNFNFIDKFKITQSDNEVFQKLYPLSGELYVLTPTILALNQAKLYFYNSTKEQIESIISFEDGLISTITMDYNPFINIDDNNYFVPNGLDYFAYKIEEDNNTLSPYLKFDFHKDAVEKNNIQKKFGATKINSDNKNDIGKSIEIQNQIQDYLINSDYYLPLVKLFNDQYIYLYLYKNNERSNYIYNRVLEKGYLITDKSSCPLYFCLHLQENVLTALVHTFELKNAINENYLTPESRVILNTVHEEDNPVIVKYYLK